MQNCIRIMTKLITIPTSGAANGQQRSADFLSIKPYILQTCWDIYDVIFSGSNCYPVNTPIQIEITSEKATLRFMGRTLYKIQDGKTEELVTDGEIGKEKKSY